MQLYIQNFAACVMETLLEDSTIRNCECAGFGRNSTSLISASHVPRICVQGLWKGQAPACDSET
jgi:hypothetical protein